MGIDENSEVQMNVTAFSICLCKNLHVPYHQTNLVLFLYLSPR